ncbi:hexitol phosphatase HxpB [Algivirga pacifica]|uniref:Hexitol phosphatase HxpB n=1 Tax=Algivirga pacifica TaxID=1162670 RepID=A0ABP9DE00_9BACT
MIKGVILDMDGLLIDSEPYWRTALIEVMASVGVEMTPEKAKKTMGLRTEEVVEYWYNHTPWQGRSTEVVATHIMEKALELILEQAPILPGVHDLINLIKEQKLALALASSSPAFMIEAIVDKIGIRDDLQVIRSGQYEKLSKPHPDIFIHTAEQLGLKFNECIVFEDSFNGVLAAKAAKMITVAVPEDQEDPRFVIADLKLKSLEEFTAETLAKLI